LTPAAPLVVCALAVAGLLAAERRESRLGAWLAKPVASLAFVVTAVLSGALDAPYGRWVVLALLLCFAGDLLLIPLARPKVFRAGVFAFLAGHLAFILAFLTRPLSVLGTVIAAIFVGTALYATWRWLRSSLSAEWRAPVLSYLVVIGVMTTLACGVAAGGGPVSVMLGAVAFAVSDVSVARDRFVRPSFMNRAWGLPLYYAAQLLLALSTRAIG
jgi:uncharacterized membrane protein YhhN